jgi:hypothetical protein
MKERIINNKYMFISAQTLITGRCYPQVLIVHQKRFRRVDGNKTTSFISYLVPKRVSVITIMW